MNEQNPKSGKIMNEAPSGLIISGIIWFNPLAELK